jgi:hypothetical protein
MKVYLVARCLQLKQKTKATFLLCDKGINQVTIEIRKKDLKKLGEDITNILEREV